uniref:Uncharacterized protein n=1 Tax=Paramormyrops kingsleyae TaxID=1676925 RepID=A0A3B3RTA8_9TELE
MCNAKSKQSCQQSHCIKSKQSCQQSHCIQSKQSCQQSHCIQSKQSCQQSHCIQSSLLHVSCASASHKSGPTQVIRKPGS